MTFVRVLAPSRNRSPIWLQRLHAEEQLLAALEAAGPSLAAATEIVQQHRDFIEGLPKHLRAALLDRVEEITKHKEDTCNE